MATAPFRCSRCGEPLYSDSAICPACGAFRSPAEDEALPPPGPLPATHARTSPDRMPPSPSRPIAESRPVADPGAPRRAVPRFAVPAAPWPPEPAPADPVPPAAPPPVAPPSAGAPARSAPDIFSGALRPEDRPVPGRRDPPLSAPAEAPRLRALPPEQDMQPSGPAAVAPPIPEETLPPEPGHPAAPDPTLRLVVRGLLRMAERRLRRVPLRPALIGAGLLVLLLGGLWLATSPSPGPAPEAPQTAATTPADEAKPDSPGIRIGTVWTRVPVAVVDGSGGRVTATGPFRLRVDGQVYTMAGEAMPIIPVEPGSRVEARAISGTVTLTLTP